MPSGLALIVYEIVSGLTFIAQKRTQWFGIDSSSLCPLPSGLALIVYGIVSGLTLIVCEIVSGLKMIVK